MQGCGSLHQVSETSLEGFPSASDRFEATACPPLSALDVRQTLGGVFQVPLNHLERAVLIGHPSSGGAQRLSLGRRSGSEIGHLLAANLQCGFRSGSMGAGFAEAVASRGSVHCDAVSPTPQVCTDASGTREGLIRDSAFPTRLIAVASSREFSQLCLVRLVRGLPPGRFHKTPCRLCPRQRPGTIPEYLVRDDQISLERLHLRTTT